MAKHKNLNWTNMGLYVYKYEKPSLLGLRMKPDAPSEERSFEDEVAVIHSDSCG